MSTRKPSAPDRGCCAGIDAVTPRRLSNPPGQYAIAYRIGRHRDFVESMRARLSSAEVPALAMLTTREASDFTNALTDALASSLDVLAFYTERVANEHYLRTATERISVREMARLIGYELAPGVAASAHLAFTLQGVPGAPVEPITIPAGTRVQSVPGQDEEAQNFETVGAVPARAEWNAIAVQQDIAHTPAFGDTDLWLDGIDTGLSVGDMLLIAGSEVETDPMGERWDVRVLTAVEPDARRQLTHVGWQRGLGHIEPVVSPAKLGVRIFTFRKRSAVFGSAAPDWRALSDEAKADYIGLASAAELQRPGDTEEWPDFTVLAPTYPERREGDASFNESLIAATVDEIAAAANAASQGAAAIAMQRAANASAGVISAGGKLVQDSVSLARQSADGLAEVVRLSIDDVAQRAHTLIVGQGLALQALQMSAGALVEHIAIDHARQIIVDQIAGLPARMSDFAANGLLDSLAVARAVLDDLQAALATSIPSTLIPNLQPLWDEAIAAVTEAVSGVQTEVADDSSPPDWLSAVPDLGLDKARTALDHVAEVLDGLDLNLGADSASATTIVREVVDNLKTAIGDHFSSEHFSELLDPSIAAGIVQDWSTALFDAGGSLGQSLAALQRTIIDAAGAEFSKLGMDVARIAQQAQKSISASAELLNPAQALAALQDGANGMAMHTREAGLAALEATAAADVAALVSTAVTIARILPAPLSVDTPEKLADVARHFAAVGVARAGGSPMSEPAVGTLFAEIASRIPPSLLGPVPAAEQLLPIVGEAEDFLDAPRDGAQAAYQQIVADVDRALAGRVVVVNSGRRKPLVREPDTIDISPTNDALVADGWALLSVPDSVELYRITRAYTASRAEYLLSGQTTRLKLKGELNGGRLPVEFEHAVRSLAVYVESEELTLARTPLHGPIYGDFIALDGHVENLVPGQVLALSGKRQRITIARGVSGLTWTRNDSINRTLVEGDSLLLMRAPVRLAGGTPHYLDPESFSATIGKQGIRLRLVLQDRDGHLGEVDLRGDEFALQDPLDDDPRVSEIVFIAATNDAVSRDRNRSYVHLAEQTSHPYARRWVKVNANVAPATHGESVEAILGSGDGSLANPRFTLNQSPLTFVSATTPSGRASTLEVRVNDALWQEVPTLHAQAPDTHVFETRQSDAAVTSIQFGDGSEGARLPSGESNIRVRYRKGLGAAGNVGAGKLTTLLSRPPGVSETINPSPASGGEDAEPLARARDNVPLTVLTLDRVVSIDDYANFARAFAGIDKAHALWIPAGPARGVFLTISGVDGAMIPEGPGTFDNLAGALATYGDPLVPVRMRNYRDARFRCRLSIKVLDDFEQDRVLQEVDAALRGRFSFPARTFGQTVSVDEVAAVAQAVRGVEAIHVTRLHRTGISPEVVPRLFAALPVASLIMVPEAAELLTLDEAPVELEVLP